MAASFRRHLVRLLACAVLALAAAPAAAQADPAPLPVPAADSFMATAHAFAVARWGMDPCGGQVAVSWTHMGPGINARSTWLSLDVHDPSTFSACAITYNLDVDWDWPKLCTVVEHELGHLSGHDHVDDPHNVMSPYYVYPAPECAAGASADTTRTAASSAAKKSTKKAAKKTTKKAVHKRKASTRKAAQARARARARAKNKASRVAKRGGVPAKKKKR